MTKVLIVDDDNDLLEMVSLVLTNYNMKVDALGQCVQFFDTMSDVQPDIVLMDIYLGECDGRDLCLDLKGRSNYSNIPVILYSAGNISVSSVKESKADDFMSKPFDITQLVSRINTHLAKRPKP
jgi:DNA-binding response OmpR family regulator